MLSAHYTGANSQLYVNGILIATFGDKNYSDPNDHIGFSLGNISTDLNSEEALFQGLDVNVYEFSVDHKIIKTDDILNIHTYLI